MPFQNMPSRPIVQSNKWSVLADAISSIGEAVAKKRDKKKEEQATKDIIEAMMGRKETPGTPQSGGPLEPGASQQGDVHGVIETPLIGAPPTYQYEDPKPATPFQSEIKPDLNKAAILAATDPALRNNPNLAKVMQAMIRQKQAGMERGNYSQPVYVAVPDGNGGTKNVLMGFDTRNNSVARPTGMPDDATAITSPEARKNVKAAETQGVKDVEVVMDPKVKAQVQGAVNTQAMNDPNSPEFQKQQKEHSLDLKERENTYNKAKAASARIDFILSDKNKDAFNKNFGGYNALASQYMPGETQNIKMEIESLKSDLKAAGLEMMRQGGSIGQMTVQEWPIVQNLIANLDPRLSEPRARDLMGEIKMRLDRIKESSNKIYSDRWENTKFYAPTNTGKQSDNKSRQQLMDEADAILGLGK